LREGRKTADPAAEQAENLSSEREEELTGPFGPVPSEVVRRVRERYGPCADRVLKEEKDLRFCNPIVVSCGGTVVCRIEDFWRRPWSVTEPEPNSLTEYYLKSGTVASNGDGWKFKKGDDSDAFVGGFACADDGAGGAGACSGE